MPNCFRFSALIAALACAAPAVMTSAVGQSPPAEEARDRWQRVPDLFDAMGVKEGATVADVGAGGGFLTVRLAQAVGASGRVYAVDIVPAVLDRLRKRLAEASVRNVEVVEGAPNDPRLPAGRLDAIVMVNSYHEVPDHAAVLRKFRDALKQSGRLVLCEPRPKAQGTTRAEQVTSHVLSPDLIVQEVTAAGFELVRRDDDFTANPSGGANAPYSLIVAAKP
jgi:ubiquinone/menaquinone biosynthesis C-methylase UbiE